MRNIIESSQRDSNLPKVTVSGEGGCESTWGDRILNIGRRRQASSRDAKHSVLCLRQKSWDWGWTWCFWAFKWIHGDFLHCKKERKQIFYYSLYFSVCRNYFILKIKILLAEFRDAIILRLGSQGVDNTRGLSRIKSLLFQGSEEVRDRIMPGLPDTRAHLHGETVPWKRQTYRRTREPPEKPSYLTPGGSDLGNLRPHTWGLIRSIHCLHCLK